MSEKKLATVADLRGAISCTPQMKLQIAAAIDKVLHDNGMRLAGKSLGDLNFCSSDEVEKIGVEPVGSTWTI